MMKSLGLTTLCLLSFSTLAVAGDPGPAPGSNMPRAGLFVGVGGSYTSVEFDQNLFALGISDVSDSTTFLAKGLAQGPARPFHDNRSGFAPEAQAGYFAHFAGSGWLWGIKSRYKYSGNITSTERDLIIPQTGAYIPTDGSPATPLAGNALIESSRTSIDHEITFLAFLGHSFGNSFLYLGAGPALFGTRSNLNGAVGFASINGAPTDITGVPVSFASSAWVLGGAAQVGVTYHFAPSWFLDFNYTYASAEKFKNDYSAPFESSSNGLTYTGTAYITTSRRVSSQAFAVSINKAFSF